MNLKKSNKSWTSDFAKAYRQVAQMIEQMPLTIVAQWCPHKNKRVLIVSAGQLFGGKNPPQNFSRNPAWWCYLMTPMYGLPLQHTVDDVMATERCSVVESCNKVWRNTTEIAGWDIPDSKSPPPSSGTCLLGADVRHHELCSVLDITEARVDTLAQLLVGHLDDNRLNAGAAGNCMVDYRLQVLSPTGSGDVQNLDQPRHADTTTTIHI